MLNVVFRLLANCERQPPLPCHTRPHALGPVAKKNYRHTRRNPVTKTQIRGFIHRNPFFSSMKTCLALTILGAALLTVPNAFGQTPPPAATSGVVGFSALSVPSGFAFVVPTLVNSSVFQGQAAISSDGLTITPTTAPSWTVGAYNATSFASPTPNYPKFYAEIVSGANEGLILDISSNSATALTMVSAVTPAGLRGTTVQIAIREHMTLNKIVQGATGLSGFSDSANVFNANGSTSTRFYDGAGSWLAEDFATPAGHTVIYPGTGFAFTATTPVSFNFMGEVKPTKTKVTLYAASTNIVGALNPASATPFYGNSISTSLAAYADGINNFSTDGQLTTVGTYFSDGSVMLDAGFSPLAPTATDAMPLNRGVVVSVGTDTVWTVNSPLAP
jgi:hypothetical protein